MAQGTRTFRVFVSSTFTDLKEERNALQRSVFPKLRRLCQGHGFRFQAIDLRWGIRDEAGLDQRTMTICLDEIKRCQNVSPRPNFIVLLGDRYGWRPLPEEIPEAEFNLIADAVTDRDGRDLLDRWYQRDANAVPTMYCLRARSGEFAEPMTWDNVERRLWAVLSRAVSSTTFIPLDRMKYGASATEQEIAIGAMGIPDGMPGAHEHVFCYFRSIRDLPHDNRVSDYVDLDEHGLPDEGPRRRLASCKESLRRLLPDNTRDYEAQWSGDGITNDHLGRLCDDVWNDLSRIMLDEIAKLEHADPVDRERDDHERLLRDHIKFFTGRTALLNAVHGYARGSVPAPLAIFGNSGSGKSALAAKVADRIRVDLPNAEVVLRFVGATPTSSDIRLLLGSLCHEISRRYGADTSPLPADYRDLIQEFPKRLAHAQADRPLVLVIDALDQLSDAEHARDLLWLPRELPDHVRLIVTTAPGGCLSALQENVSTVNAVELEPMTADEGGALLDAWLKNARRKLQPEQRSEVLEKFAQAGGSPLYLKLAFEEARQWRAHSQPNALSRDIHGIVRDFFGRLSQGSNHGHTLVSRALGYLASAKNGLTEDELLDLLSSDESVVRDFVARARHEPPEQRLPVVIWSRLYLDLEPYLSERAGDGASLFTFYHRQLREVVVEDYLAGDDARARHAALAQYFSGQRLYEEDGRTPNLRKLSELPYQQTTAEQWGEVRITLMDFHFLEAKCSHVGVGTQGTGDYTRTVYGGVYELLEDYRRALGRCPDLRGMFRFLGRNSHILSRFPDLLYQQAANEREDPAPQLLAHSVDSPRPWLRLVNAVDSQQERIITVRSLDPKPAVLCWAPDSMRFVASETANTLALYQLESGERGIRFVGHKHGVSSCRWSPTRDRLLTTSLDGELRIWDTTTGSCIRALATGGDGLVSGDWSPSGDRIVTTSYSGTLRIWDPVGGHCLGLRRDSANGACTWSRGGLVATTCSDHSIKIWNPTTGTCDAVLSGHTAEVHDVTWSPSGVELVSASRDGLVFVWDAKSGTRLRGLVGHPAAVLACAWASSGLIATGDAEGHLIVWNASDGRILWETDPGSQRLTDCAWSSSGYDLLTATDDGIVVAWRLLAKPAETRSLSLRPSGPCDWSPDSRWIACAAHRVTHVIDFTTGTSVARLHSSEDLYGAHPVAALSWSPDGVFLARATVDGTVMLFDMTTQGFPAVAKLTSASNIDAAYGDSSLKWSPNAAYLAAENGAEVIVWEVSGRTVVARLPMVARNIQKFLWSSASDRVLVLSHGRLSLWDVGTGQLAAMLWSDEGDLVDVSWPGGDLLLAAGPSGYLRTWDLASGRVRMLPVPPNAEAMVCACSPDQTTFACAFFGGIGRAWTAEGAIASECRLATNLPLVCSWSPNGIMLLFCGRYAGLGREVSIWQMGNARTQMTFVCGGDARAAVWSPAGDRLAITDSARQIHVLALEGSELSASVSESLNSGPVHLKHGPVARCPGCGADFLCYNDRSPELPGIVSCPACEGPRRSPPSRIRHPTRRREETFMIIGEVAVFGWMFESYNIKTWSSGMKYAEVFFDILRQTLGDFEVKSQDDLSAIRESHALANAPPEVFLPHCKRLGQMLTKEERLVFLREAPRLAGQRLETMDRFVEAIIGLAATEMGVHWDRERRLLSVDS